MEEDKKKWKEEKEKERFRFVTLVNNEKLMKRRRMLLNGNFKGVWLTNLSQV